MNDDFYQARILDTARAATGAGSLPSATASAEVDNPLCGDRVRVEVQVEQGEVRAVAHRVRGCLLCEAAAAVIGEHAPGGSVTALGALADGVRSMLTEGRAPPGGWEVLAMFEPVAARPSRHECVLLPFEALAEALKTSGGDQGP